MRSAHLALAIALSTTGCQPQSETAPSQTAPAAPQTVTVNTFQVPWTVDRFSELKPATPSRLAKNPTPLPRTAELESTLAILDQVVDKHASNPSNAWALSHGIMARGTDFATSDGRTAVDALFEDWAERTPVGDATLIGFPRSQGETRIEPHTDLILKVLTEAGVDPNRKVTVQGHPHTVSDLYRSAVLRAHLVAAKNEASWSSPNDMPWSLSALSAWAPADLTWVSTQGTKMSMSDFTTFVATVLVKESQFLFQAMEAHAGFNRTGQSLFNYTCGGSHLLQGAAHAVGRGHGSELAKKAILAQIPLLYWRVPEELAVYDKTLNKAPQHLIILLAQRLKFTGHALESLAGMAALGLYQPTPTQQGTMNGLAQQITLTTKALQEQGLLNRLDEIQTKNPQLYLDLVGDSAHAAHALRLATAEAGIPK